MSSNQRIKKVCEHCNEIFIAQKATTKYCSLICAQRNYKLREKRERLKKVEAPAVVDSLPPVEKVGAVKAEAPAGMGDLITIQQLAQVTNLSERTLFRLIKDPEFPKIRIGRNLLFHRETVIQFIVRKYSTV